MPEPRNPENDASSYQDAWDRQERAVMDETTASAFGRWVSERLIEDSAADVSENAYVDWVLDHPETWPAEDERTSPEQTRVVPPGAGDVDVSERPSPENDAGYEGADYYKVDDLADWLHPWLEGRPFCAFSPKALCPHARRSMDLARALLCEGGWIEGFMYHRLTRVIPPAKAASEGPDA